jgi:ribokinase
VPDVKPRVVVVGSLNVDLIARVRALPAAGETIFASEVVRRFGGKGANQALAASRLGAEVRLIGAVGDDEHGRAYREHWRRHGLDDAGIATIPRVPTGTAMIAVDGQGENQIIVNAGANGRVTPRLVRAQAESFRGAALVLLQGEVPVDAIDEAMRLARRHGVRVVFNPSPWPAGFVWDGCAIFCLVINEQEGLYVRVRGKIENVVLTRGAKSTIWVDARGHARDFATAKLPRPVVDTVGAGDTFAGALAVELARGAEFGAAIPLANCAAGLATLKVGAQEAMPRRGTVLRRMREVSRKR